MEAVMHTRASIADHPVHPMLVVFPIGLFLTALVFDIMGAATGNPVWETLAFYDIAAGVIGGLVAALPGFVDYFTLRGEARRLGNWHMILNLGVVALFAVNWYLRTDAGHRWVGAGSRVPLALTIIGAVILAVSGWIGGHLVYVHRVGVAQDVARYDDSRSRRVA
jgi:uncharacterized membrane protein